MRSLALCSLLLLACQPQAETGYLGEPLLTLQGQVRSNGAIPSLEAAMLWQRGAPPSTNDAELATRAPVTAGFPATFTISLYQPPPAAAQRTLAPGQPVYARANAGAVSPGTVFAPVSAGATGDAGFGIDAAHWVIYLFEDAAPGSVMEWWLGAPLSKGFHLVHATAVNPACITPAALAACEADLAARGLADGSALCLAAYRLAPAAPGEQLILDLSLAAAPVTGPVCP